MPVCNAEPNVGIKPLSLIIEPGRDNAMYTAVNGIYENGNLTLTKTPPTTKKTKVVVLFLEEQKDGKRSGKGVKLGSLAGKYSIPDDFNEPLDDLKEYM